MKQISDISKIFRPLLLKNADIYYGCAKELMDKSLDAGSMSERNAKLFISEYLSRNAFELDERDFEEDALPPDTANLSASRIILVFRKYGWMQEKSLLNLDSDTADLTPECRELIRFLSDFLEGSRAVDVNGNLISLSEEICTTNEDNWARPYRRILSRALREISGIREQLRLLMEAMDELARMTADIEIGSDIETFLLDNPVFKNTISLFYREKQGGLTEKYIRKISDGLSVLKKEENVSRLALDLSSLYGLSQKDAKERVLYEICTIQDFVLVEYRSAAEEIETRYLGFHKRLLMRLRLASNRGFNFEAVMSDILSCFAKADEEGKQKIAEKLLPCILASRSRTIIPQDVKPLKKREAASDADFWKEEFIFPEEKIREDEAFFEAQRNDPYQRENIISFMDKSLESGPVHLSLDMPGESLFYILEAFLLRGSLPYDFEVHNESPVAIGDYMVSEIEVKKHE